MINVSAAPLEEKPPRRAPVAGVLVLLSLSCLIAARNLDTLGRWFIQEDRVIEGIYCYEIMTSLSAAFGMHDFRLLAALDNLADAYARMGRYSEAIKSEMEVRRLVVLLEGTRSSNYYLAQAHTAQFMVDKKDYAKSRSLLEQALTGLDQLKQPAPWVQAYAMNVLVDVCIHQKDFAKAEEIAQKLVPLDDRMTAETSYPSYCPRLSLAEIYIKTGRLPEAEAIADSWLKACGPSAKTAVKADAHELKARVLLASGNTQEAKREFDKAGELLGKLYGRNAERTQFLRARFDKCLQDKNPFPL